MSLKQDAVIPGADTLRPGMARPDGCLSTTLSPIGLTTSALASDSRTATALLVAKEAMRLGEHLHNIGSRKEVHDVGRGKAII